MKKLIALYLFVLALTTAAAMAGASRNIESTSTEGFYSAVNLARDSGFENLNKSAAWSVSGGVLSTTTLSPAKGSVTGTWDSSSAGQTLTSKLIATPAGLYNRNGVVSCLFKTGSGTATHTITASTGAAELATPVTIPSSTSTYQRVSVNFIFPDSLSTQIKITSVAANEPLINIDDCYMGPADGFNISNVSQARFLGSITYAGTTSCAWSSTSATYANFAADTDCPTPTVTGQVSAPTTKIPGARFINGFGPGTVYAVSSGIFTGLSGTGPQCAFRFSDGTNGFGYARAFNTSGANSSSVIGEQTYTAPQGDTTIQVQTAAYAGSSTPTCGIEADTNSFEPLTISFYHYPSTSEALYRPDAPGNQWTSFTPTGSWSTNTTYAGQYRCDGDNLQVQTSVALAGAPTSATLTVNLPSGFTIDAAKMANSSSFRTAIGTAYLRDDSPGNNLPAFTMYNDTSSVYVAIGSSTSGLGATLNQVSSTVPFTFASSDLVTLSYEVPVTAGSPCSRVRAPLLVGSVTSNSSGSERIERVTVTSSCTSTPCTMASNSAGITSVTRASSGNYTANYSAFSAVPSCTVLTSNNGATINSTITTTAFSFLSVNSAGTPTDGSMNIICMGPR